MRTAHVLVIAATISCGSATPQAPPGAPINPPQEDDLLAMLSGPAPAAAPMTISPAMASGTPQLVERSKQLAGDFAKFEAEAPKEKARFESLRQGLAELRNKDFPNPKAAINAVLKSPHRVPGNPERDAFRHPLETLAFFGLRQDMQVLELDVGAGWYTELLAPLLWKKGKLTVTSGDPSGSRSEMRTLVGLKTKALLDKAPELGDKVSLLTTGSGPWNLGAEGSYDLVLSIRNAHNWQTRGKLDENLAAIFKALKPGGTLGMIDHRAPKGGDPKVWAEKGYLPEEFVLERAKAAGFKLEGKSEVNANPKDTKDHPEGVWTLPPTLRLGDKDKAKYTAIGESDRFTLKFSKPKK